ncbi:hypothetical protein BD289DRAFT_431958 [Coniella lustricola]|uniref:Uncharacterized protein n=1 Tax=Coniella lustricola TaxID=2025994 RepID=A0A2T3AAE0_9PEZI|nr:hypothetical protein BD289DRAFT_431958 [Coniella lustricola]
MIILTKVCRADLIRGYFARPLHASRPSIQRTCARWWAYCCSVELAQSVNVTRSAYQRLCRESMHSWTMHDVTMYSACNTGSCIVTLISACMNRHLDGRVSVVSVLMEASNGTR